MCHVSVFIWGPCFFLSYPVGHMVEHGADMGDFCAFPVYGLSLCVILGSLCLLWHVLTATGRSDSAGHLRALCVHDLTPVCVLPAAHMW